MTRQEANKAAAKWARAHGFPVPGPQWDAKRKELGVSVSAGPAAAPTKRAKPRPEAPKPVPAIEQKLTAKGYRSWTEEELLLLYWALPIMRSLSRLTGRGFPAIAMKMANLLAADTENREGLANTSALDRAVVARYTQDRPVLERKVVEILNREAPTRSRAGEIRDQATDILKVHGVPLHIDLVGALLASRDPLLIASAEVIREAFRSSPAISEVSRDVYRYGVG